MDIVVIVFVAVVIIIVVVPVLPILEAGTTLSSAPSTALLQCTAPVQLDFFQGLLKIALQAVIDKLEAWM